MRGESGVLRRNATKTEHPRRGLDLSLVYLGSGLISAVELLICHQLELYHRYSNNKYSAGIPFGTRSGTAQKWFSSRLWRCLWSVHFCLILETTGIFILEKEAGRIL